MTTSGGIRRRTDRWHIHPTAKDGIEQQYFGGELTARDRSVAAASGEAGPNAAHLLLSVA